MSEPVTESTLEEDVLRDNWTAAVRPRRELAHRASGGIEVTLYWSAHDNSTSIEVWQSASEELLYFGVDRERALEAFYHPFAHLHHGVQNTASATCRAPASAEDPTQERRASKRPS